MYGNMLPSHFWFILFSLTNSKTLFSGIKIDSYIWSNMKPQCIKYCLTRNWAFWVSSHVLGGSTCSYISGWLLAEILYKDVEISCRQNFYSFLGILDSGVGISKLCTVNLGTQIARFFSVQQLEISELSTCCDLTYVINSQPWKANLYCIFVLA